MTTGSESSTWSVRLFARTIENDRVRGIVEVLFDFRWGPMCRPFPEEVLQSTCGGLGYSRQSAQYFDAVE